MVVAERNDERTVRYARETLRGELPEALAWIHLLTRPNLIIFIVELRAALERYGVTGDESELLELVDAWEATAAIDADEELADHLRLPRGKKEYVDWVPNR